MEMKIGTRVAELRRKKGLTQEQLANQLGVSAPAISKWETDASYPDITLLCPLARALDTNVDTLLQFEEQLSDQQVVDLINNVIETARHDGPQAGEQQLLALLHKYPNSIALKFNAATVWDYFQMSFPTTEEELRRTWTKHKQELLHDVRASGMAAYWQVATLQLATIAMSEGDLEQCEALLNELPEHTADPTSAWALLYLKKEQPEQALKIVQKRLYALLHQVQTCLILLLNPDITTDNEQALQICGIHRSLAELFGFAAVADGLFLEVYLRMHRYNEAAESLVRYANAITSEAFLSKQWLFTPGLTFKENPPATTKELRRLLLHGLEDAQCDPLRHDPRYQKAVEIIKASL